MIQENEKIKKNMNLFQDSKKQDDLNLIYLQGIYWLNK